jgi:hypothetical protein
LRFEALIAAADLRVSRVIATAGEFQVIEALAS